ncbi:hypothetical protein EGM85_11470 [Macrococcus caseolyticus]|nr:hypothetical protein [Macrococcus caseolyticus]RKO11412.1 hypothetical protein D6861_11470 [Macrococcus caseolyticus]
MKQLSVCASADLIDYSGFQVNKHSPGHVFAGTGLAEEGVEGVVATTHGLVCGHLAIGLDSMLKAV